MTSLGASIVSLVEPDNVKRTNPEADTVLNEGATLILAGDRKTIAAMKRLLTDGKVQFMDNIVLEIGLALGLMAIAVLVANKLGVSNIPFLIVIGMAVGPHAPQFADRTA